MCEKATLTFRNVKNLKKGTSIYEDVQVPMFELCLLANVDRSKLIGWGIKAIKMFCAIKLFNMGCRDENLGILYRVS